MLLRPLLLIFGLYPFATAPGTPQFEALNAEMQGQQRLQCWMCRDICPKNMDSPIPNGLPLNMQTIHRYLIDGLVRGDLKSKVFLSYQQTALDSSLST
jgi:hypothetical protein